mmetsp:Transcript_11729/g.32352  ORF Transcript_11729/g.32352 Transcript_11729/m.32352 type:complete len:94 (-) Transcript_11729:71-352(-)
MPQASDDEEISHDIVPHISSVSPPDFSKMRMLLTCGQPKSGKMWSDSSQRRNSGEETGSWTNKGGFGKFRITIQTRSARSGEWKGGFSNVTAK